MGAAQGAPTAPHATPREDGGAAARTGPERFWSRSRARIAFAVSLVLSSLVHGPIFRLDLPHGLEIREVEGEAAIPVDLLGPDEAPTPAPATPSAAGESPENPAPAAAERPPGPGADAGGTDAAVTDAARDAVFDGEGAEGQGAADARPLSDGAVLDGSADAAGGKRDPEELLSAESVRADRILVELHINAEVIRRHPVGARMGYLLRGIPQWDDFLSGTDVDPVRDTDWVLISGPSLRHTERDVVLVHYSAPDAVVDRAVAIVSRRYDHGGAFDAGIPGMKAALAHADRADRVIFRPQPHLLAVVPPNRAAKLARTLVSSRVREHSHAGVAVYLRVVDPHHAMAEIPESITEMRIRVVPRTDAGADVLAEGDAKDADSALEAADGIRRMVRRHDDVLTSLLTHGLLDHVTVTTEGATVKAQLTATRDQIETVLALVGGVLGVEPPASSAESPASPAPTPPASGPSRPGQPR